jgi:hypothetical protein
MFLMMTQMTVKRVAAAGSVAARASSCCQPFLHPVEAPLAYQYRRVPRGGGAGEWGGEDAVPVDPGRVPCQPA